ncbi:MAG: adenylate/guanylate cyclase domain-containing protein [Myxococcota bacterium]
MRCGRCGTELIEGKKFCHACGARALVGCASCGAPLDPDFRFCPDCGAPVATAEPSPAADPAGEESAPVPAVATAEADGDRFSRLVRHIPAALAEKIRHAGTVSGERKRATILFCDLVGSTAIAEGLDPEEYRELLEPYLELAFAEVYRFEGVVNQLSGDGLMALFGAPVSYENDPERAVRAAVAIQRALAELAERSRGIELSVRIGVHTGMVVVGAMGNDLKMDYTAIGDTTNLAARLQTLAAPGSILVSDATHRHVRDDFRTHAVGPFEVKGKSEPIAAYEVLELSQTLAPVGIARSEGLTPLVGRDEQLAQLYACYERSRGRLGQVVSVVGAAGSGKSRLVYEFKQRLVDEPTTLFEARCSSLTRGVSHSLWVAMIQRYFGIVPGEPASESCGKIADGLAELGSYDEDIAPSLCALLSLPSAGLEGASADEVGRQSFAAVVELVKRATRHAPIVMIVEDLHWIDDASREMLELSASEFAIGRSMLLVTHRPQYEPVWQSVAALTQLHLAPLSDREGVEIVRSRAGGPLPAALEELVLAKGEGNPLYLEELTKTLLEEGTVVSSAGRVEVTRAVEDIRIPDTVHELLEARLDRLRPEAKRVAQIASVLGRQFRSHELVALMADEPIEVERELEELERLGVLHRKVGLDADEFRFGESLTQEVAYGALLLRERRALHQRVGELLEAAAGESGGVRLPLIAHHFARSDDRGKGIRLLLQAAAAAEALPSYGDAGRLYREAWDLAEAALREPDADAKELRLRLLEATHGVARVSLLDGSGYGDERAAARRGVELAEQLGDEEALAKLLSTYGSLVIAVAREDFGDGLALIEKAVAVARQGGYERTAARISRSLGWTFLLDGRFDDARRETERALREIERLDAPGGPSDSYLGALFFHDRVLFEADELEAADRSLREAYRLAIEVKNRTLQSGNAAVLAGLEFTRGDYAEAVRWSQLAVGIAEQIDNAAALRSCRAVQLAVWAESGEGAVDPAELERFVASAWTNAETAINSNLVVEALLAAGEVDRARRVAEATALRAGGRLREARSSLSLGLVSLALGPSHWGDAEEHFLGAADGARSIGARSVYAHALLGAAELAARRGEPGALRTSAEEAAAIYRELGMGRYEAKARALLGHALSGHVRHLSPQGEGRAPR